MATLATLRSNAQSKLDAFVDPNTTTAEWNSWINASAGDLYRDITNTNEDYNIAQMQFTLTGNSYQTNFLDVTTLPALGAQPYWKIRLLELQMPNATSDPWISLYACPSVKERHKYSRTIYNPLYRCPVSAYLAWGNKIEILPAFSSAGTYQLSYIPQLPLLVNDSDSFDGYWLSANGIDDFISLDAAIKYAIKNTTDVTPLWAQREELKASIIRSMSCRNADQPGQIADVIGYGLDGSNDNGFW